MRRPQKKTENSIQVVSGRNCDERDSLPQMKVVDDCKGLLKDTTNEALAAKSVLKKTVQSEC